MRFLKKTLIIAIHLCTVVTLCFAQSNDLEARAACLKGEEEYDNGNYSNAIIYLQEAKSKLGETKTRIQYTLVRALKAADKYAEAKKELKIFFDVTPEDNYETHFLEMVKSIVDLNEYVKLEEDKIRATQIQEQQRLVAIERERREREAKRVEEQRKAEARRVEAARLELQYNKKMAVAGTWKVESSGFHRSYSFPDYIQIIIDNSKTVSLKFAYIGGGHLNFQFSGTPSNCPSNFCRIVEGTLTISGGEYGIFYSKPAKEVLQTPCKLYMEEDGSKLIMEFREYDFAKKSLIFRDYIVLKDNILKLTLNRDEYASNEQKFH